MRFHWLLPSLLGIVLLSSPAEAARLQSWQFDADQNRLDFTTDDGVQPKAQLIANPTRLVIDLSGTKVGGALRNQTVGGAIRAIRVGQFDPQTTRIVVELAPGYTMNPQEVRFRGRAANQWSVQLPQPQRVAIAPNPSTELPPDRTSTPTNTSSETEIRGAIAQIQGVQVTPDGLFVRTTGRPSRVDIDHKESRQRIEITLNDTLISPRATKDLVINRYGINRLQLTQVKTSPPVARITLNVAKNSPRWQATVSNLGGVVLVPLGEVANSSNPRLPNGGGNNSSSNLPSTPQIATIQAVDLNTISNQLLVRTDRPVQYNSGWDRASGSYRLALSPARLADQVRGPQLDASSPLLRVRLRQEDAQTVAILVQPAAGVQLGDVNQPSSQLVALQLQRSRPSTLPPTGSPIGSIPVPPPATNTPPTTTLPRAPRGKVLVIVDPGHGGPDPGAVGVNGLQEKGIVFDISQKIAARLEQQGVQAVLTRPDDRDLDLEPRVAMAERMNATVFVSIHANSISLSRPDVNGLETYYYQSGERLAQTIHSNILQNVRIQDRGVRTARFYVLRKTSMPAVLVEVGFVTGAEDAAKLSTDNYRSQMADAIARGVLQYLQQNY